MTADDISKPRAKVVDCIVVTPEVHNKHSENEGAPPEAKPTRRLSRFSRAVPDFYATVKNRVLLINKEMSAEKMPYRYDVKAVDGKLLIDMLVLDKHGDIALQHTKEVTSSNYKTILDNLQSGVGFLFDD
jgi:hypothetical protein